MTAVSPIIREPIHRQALRQCRACADLIAMTSLVAIGVGTMFGLLLSKVV